MKNKFQFILFLAVALFSAVVIFLFKIGVKFNSINFIFGLIGFFVCWLFVGIAYSFVCYFIKGYSVEASRRELRAIIYKERGNGFIELFIEICQDDNSHYSTILYVPSEVDWRRDMPKWAKKRRREIMQRIIDEQKTSDFRYHGYVDD